MPPELASGQSRGRSLPSPAPPGDDGAAVSHASARAAAHPLLQKEEAGPRSLAEAANVLGDSWSGATGALMTFLADAQQITFSGHTVTGDDHLVGWTRPSASQPAKSVRKSGEHFLPGSEGTLGRLSEHWHQDMRALQSTTHYRTYRYAWLAARILTGTLSPLQAGIFIGSAALPLIDARFPDSSDAARNALMAASIVADPFGFAAGSAALVGMRLAMQHASADRRSFWQCMTFVLTRQLTAHALGA